MFPALPVDCEGWLGLSQMTHLVLWFLERAVLSGSTRRPVSQHRGLHLGEVSLWLALLGVFSLCWLWRLPVISGQAKDLEEKQTGGLRQPFRAFPCRRDRTKQKKLRARKGQNYVRSYWKSILSTDVPLGHLPHMQPLFMGLSGFFDYAWSTGFAGLGPFS